MRSDTILSKPIVSLLFAFVLVSFLFIGQVQASYLQVQNGSTLQASNVSQYSTTSTSYVPLLTIVVPANISGIFDISSYCGWGAISGGKCVPFKNGIQMSLWELAPDDSWQYRTWNFSGQLNTTDLLEIRAKNSGGGTIQAKNMNLSYDYVPAPTILSPANNSAQTSRIVNIAWNGTAPFQYQICGTTDCSNQIFNSSVLNNFTGNLTLPYRQSYIRIRGYNQSTDAVTNWTDMHYIFIFNKVTNYTILNISGLVGWWHFDDNLLDSSSSGNTLTLVNAPLANYTGGHYNNGTRLNDSGYYNTSNISAYNINRTDNFSIILWGRFINSTHANGRQYFASNLGANLGGFEWYYGNVDYTNFNLYQTGLASYIATQDRTNSTIYDNKYHQLVISYNGSSSAYGIKFYVDTIEKPLTIVSNNIVGSSVSDKPMFIGSRPFDTYGFFNGTMDEVMFFNRVLNQTEISMSYLGLSTGSYVNISWGNTVTNNNSLNISVYNNTEVIFNTSSDENITSWYWNNVSGTVDNLTITYSLVGTYYLDVFGQSNNGTTNLTTWRINVLTPPVSFISPTIQNGYETWNKNFTMIRIQGTKAISSATLHWYPRQEPPASYSMVQENSTVFNYNFTNQEDDRFSYWVNVSFVDGEYYELGKGDGNLIFHTQSLVSYFKKNLAPSINSSIYDKIKIRYKSFVGGATLLELAWTNTGLDCAIEIASCYQDFNGIADGEWHTLFENITDPTWRGDIDLIRLNPWNGVVNGTYYFDYIELYNSSNTSEYYVIDEFTVPSFWASRFMDNNFSYFTNYWVQFDQTLKSNVVGSNVYLHQKNNDSSYFSSTNYNESGMSLVEFEWGWAEVPTNSNNSHVIPIYRCYYSTGGYHYDDTDCGANSSVQIGYILNIWNLHTVPLNRYVNASGYRVTLADRIGIPLGYSFEKRLGYAVRGYMHQEDMVYINNSEIRAGFDKKFGVWAYLSNNSDTINLLNTLNSGRMGNLALYRMGTYENPYDTGFGEYFYFDMNPASSGSKYNDISTALLYSNSSSEASFTFNISNYNPDWGNHIDSGIRMTVVYSLEADPHVLNINTTTTNMKNVTYGTAAQELPSIALVPKYTHPFWYNGTGYVYFGSEMASYPNYFTATSPLFLALFDENNESGIGSWNWGKPPGYIGVTTNDTNLTNWDQNLNGMSNDPIYNIKALSSYNTHAKVYLGNKTSMGTYFGGLQYSIEFNSITPINTFIQSDNLIVKVDTTDLGQISNATLNWHNNTGNFSLEMTVDEIGTFASITMAGLLEFNYSYNVSSYSTTGIYAVTDTIWTKYDITSPISLSNLQNTTTTTSVNWTWTDPSDADFDHVIVWLNNVSQANVSADIQYFLASGLTPNTDYTISTRTVDFDGNVNQTWVNQTARTSIYNAIPPSPVWVSNTIGSYWVNHTWQAGAGNVTDSFNVSHNGTWMNGTVITSLNASLNPLGWSNITVWAWNNTGFLSATSISNNSQAPALLVSGNTTPQLSSVTNNTAGAHSINISFSVNQSNAITWTKYGTTGSMTSKTSNQSSGSSRWDNITSLTNATTYYYSVWAANTSNTSLASNSTIKSFMTAEDYLPPGETNGTPVIFSYSPTDLTPTIDVNALTTFNAGGNQSVQWTWTGATEGAGDGTTNSTAIQTWTTTGAKTVTVTCSNANGSCGTIQWDITVIDVSTPLNVINTISSSVINAGEVILNGNTTNVTGTATVWFEYGGNPSSYLYKSSIQSISGNGSFSSKINGMSLISGKTYYYKASGSYNGIDYDGTQKSFTMLTLTPTNYNFDKHFDNFTNSGLNITNMTSIGASPYTDILGSIFWGLLFAVIFIMIWMRQEDITIPSLLGLIVGASLWSSMPADWTSMAMSLTVISFAGMMYSIIKGRQ